MDQGQLHAARAAEARRFELGLSQKGTGVDPKTWRQFVEGEKWPETLLTRSRIEAHLDWHTGALDRIASGESTSADEVIDRPRQRQPETQEDAEARLEMLEARLRMLEAEADLKAVEEEAVRRRLALLAKAAEENRHDDVKRLVAELEEFLKGPESDRP